MNENNLTVEEKPKKSLKQFLVNFLTNKKFLISLGIIFVLTIFEFTTDFVEITVGSVLELTNPYRPKSGTIWELHKKDRLASEQLEEITKSLPEQRQEIPEINDLVQLKDLLQQNGTVLITAEQFHDLYNQIPIRFSGDVISPFDLLKLSHSKKWIGT